MPSRAATANYCGILDILTGLALGAAAEIEAIAATGFACETKADHSPVTEADRRAEAVILAGLARGFPDIPVVAEEAVSAGHAPAVSSGRFFLVDPLDGTKEFVARRSDYTVNIALIDAGRPVAGVVVAPRMLTIYRGCSGHEKFAEKAALSADLMPQAWNAIGVRPIAERPVVLVSRSHHTPETDEFVAGLGECSSVAVGSSLKFCMIAEGSADLYPRFGPTMEWDTAAGDAVLRAAGGHTSTVDGQPLVYGKAGGQIPFGNPHFIAGGEGEMPAIPR